MIMITVWLSQIMYRAYMYDQLLYNVRMLWHNVAIIQHRKKLKVQYA